MKVKKVTDLNRISLSEFKQIDKLPLVVVLDNVRSLNNIGSIFRTADAFRIQSIYLCGITATPPNIELHKTALGAEDSVDWKYFEKTEDAVLLLKKEGFYVCALEQAQESIMLDRLAEVVTEKQYALILGNEVKGVTQDIVDICDSCVEIPQEGTKHSLNVSVAAGIAIWDFFKMLKSIKD